MATVAHVPERPWRSLVQPATSASLGSGLGGCRSAADASFCGAQSQLQLAERRPADDARRAAAHEHVLVGRRCAEHGPLRQVRSAGHQPRATAAPNPTRRQRQQLAGLCVGRLGVCAWARLGCHLSAVATVAGAACRACRRMRLGGHPCMWPPLQAGKLRSSFCWSMCVNCPLHKDPPFRSTPALTPCTPPAAQLTPARCRVHAFTHAPPLQPLPIRHRVGFAAQMPSAVVSTRMPCHAMCRRPSLGAIQPPVLAGGGSTAVTFAAESRPFDHGQFRQHAARRRAAARPARGRVPSA